MCFFRVKSYNYLGVGSREMGMRVSKGHKEGNKTPQEMVAL